MKIEITRDGYLKIRDTQKLCPYKASRCGEWCALFTTDTESTVTNIYLCHKIYSIANTDFIDLRLLPFSKGEKDELKEV